MNAPPKRGESGPNKREASRLIRFGILRGRSSRDLPLVRWSVWLFIAAMIALLILVIWGLATHQPSSSVFDSDF
jgi:hypothetical protein